MKRQDYDHSKLTGIDVDIEISLKEYGIAWIETDTEYLFYYGIGFTQNEDNETEYNYFDFTIISNDIDICKEYDWVDWQRFLSFLGIDKKQFLDTPLSYQLHELQCYYGFESIFGTSYRQGLTFDEVNLANL